MQNMTMVADKSSFCYYCCCCRLPITYSFLFSFLVGWRTACFDLDKFLAWSVGQQWHPQHKVFSLPEASSSLNISASVWLPRKKPKLDQPSNCQNRPSLTHGKKTSIPCVRTFKILISICGLGSSILSLKLSLFYC